MLHAMIMAGGGGTRFWPRSRQQRPKQFLKLAGDRTLLQQAVDRLEAAAPAERTWIVTAAAQRDESARLVPQLSPERIVGEPCGRDTAACIGLGAALIEREDPEAVIVVTPADHVIEPAQEFRRAVHVAVQIVEEHPDALVTVGIPPTFAATGYGYIQRGPEIAQRQGLPVFQVASFREKPNAELAEEFLATGEYYWNSGLFCWKARTILEALGGNQPALAQAIERIADAWPTPERHEVFRREYENAPRISIDYAVMEKAKKVLVVRAPYRWDDVGSWLALERLHPQDAQSNTILGQHVGFDTQNCVIAADPGVLVATAGVDHLLIVQDGDAILVADKRDEAAVKKLVDLIKQKGLENYL
ncbi:MAG: mannose-1-phosphate guanylyltransferase [Gemmataceae bacterium]|nr:mannose-1-phosphate guanylyltransferase [Gemmataceae bacterium]